MYQQTNPIYQNSKAVRDMVLLLMNQRKEEDDRKKEDARKRKEEEDDRKKEEAWKRKKEENDRKKEEALKRKEEEQAPKPRGKNKTFNERMKDLKRFKETHGHANVTIREEKSLSKFCDITRYARNNPGKGTKLTDKR